MTTEKRTFSPTLNGRGLKPDEYKDAYPELDERDETRNLRGLDLMWCWYYGSKESPYVRNNDSHKVKSAFVSDLVFDIIRTNEFYEEGQIQLLRDGIIPVHWYPAIEFFKNVNTDKRVDAKAMMEKLYNDYMSIIERGIEGFRNADGEVDYTKYSNTTKMIKNEIPDLINTIEKGYGTSVLMSHGDSADEGQYWCEQYIKGKR